MKIGILTLPLHTNYGGILQAYALQTILERMGHEVILLDRGWIKKSFVHNVLSWIKWTLKSLFSRRQLLSPQILEKMGQRIKPFIYTHISSRIAIRRISDIEPLQLDVIVVGSDQVWRKYYNPNNIAFYYLDFAKEWNIKRISYAASFGIDQWDYSQEETFHCKNLLQLFTGVSVREESGKTLCFDYLNREAEVVLDPTMLLNASEYKQLAQQDSKEVIGELLCYILDSNIDLQNIVGSISHLLNYRPYYTNLDEREFSSSKGTKPSVEYWLKGFVYAKFVVTDSFHGCVFSILFNKPFLAYGNKQRGMARFSSLLSQFGLEDRLVTSLDEVNEKMSKEIDWESVNMRLAELRQKSLTFLETNLSK